MNFDLLLWYGLHRRGDLEVGKLMVRMRWRLMMKNLLGVILEFLQQQFGWPWRLSRSIDPPLLKVSRVHF